jgi:hydroxymethylbilane synthase
VSESIVIATRESPLALWQAEHVKSRLEEAHPGIEVSLLGMTSRGDQLLDKPLFKGWWERPFCQRTGNRFAG